ncbi:MAG TPA: site-specific DNA-methyltransferase [Bryobacteraceae bacterium]|nr:site-specific DNA-methyltransferase [Bryobacteraceae bacterium]
MRRARKHESQKSGRHQILQGDVAEQLRRQPDAMFAGVFCDPPYGIGFAGLKWDSSVPASDTWREILRVMKPGAFLLAFGGSRTFHRLTCAIEDAGFEIRDSLCWLYGSGFPKSKSCLKPAWEPIVLARKRGPMQPLAIEVSRIGDCGGSVTIGKREDGRKKGFHVYHDGLHSCVAHSPAGLGRWPANVVMDEAAGKQLDAQTGAETSRFFYCAKASPAERGDNRHPCVKPLKLTEYLARLIMPPGGGDMLVPFSGSGSEMVGAVRAGWNRILGVEMDPAHIAMAQKRLDRETANAS